MQRASIVTSQMTDQIYQKKLTVTSSCTVETRYIIDHQKLYASEFAAFQPTAHSVNNVHWLHLGGLPSNTATGLDKISDSITCKIIKIATPAIAALSTFDKDNLNLIASWVYII